MLASLADAPLDDPGLLYEPKYDGIRAIAEVPAGGQGVRLWSRLGNEKTKQFPEVAAALSAWARRRSEPVVLDGEVVALDVEGQPTGFQQLQGRIHLTQGEPTDGRVAYIAFDLLREGGRDLRERPLVERRAALETLFGRLRSPRLRISEQAHGDGRAMYDRALASGWEGLIAKDAQSKYESGRRSPEWRKLKIVQEQEFVVGGWTDPRQSRAYFGALLLGVYDDAHDSVGDARVSRRLVYVGHTGTGFDHRELGRVMKLLRGLATNDCPFVVRPRTNERPHWVRPELVAQIKFTEWTSDNKLRHPVYLGLRDDKPASAVRRERKMRLTTGTIGRRLPPAAEDDASAQAAPTSPPPAKTRRVAPSGRRASHAKARTGARPAVTTGPAIKAEAIDRLIDQSQEIENSRRDGVLELPDGDRFPVTNLHKVFWPRQKLTKGDLFRYHMRVARYLLPAVADRPLVMKRFPNGVDGKPFYQHRAADPPPGVRVEPVQVAERRPQLIGGDLKTLLYTTQLAAISQDPWFSRVQSPQFADYVALDLDPSDGVPFATVLDVARWIRDELETLGAESVAKTSGADGLHIYIPLPPQTNYEAGLLFCQIVATVVCQRHPQFATVERSVRARGRKVYVDCLQNILGKTLATAYSARASEYAGVSTPLTWKEIDSGVRREDFTIRTVPNRLADVGDLWERLRMSEGVDLSAVARYHR